MDPRWKETADALGMSIEDLLTIASYETGGTLNPRKKGPTTQWGQHEGLIQFGEPQRAKYGVDLSSDEAAMSSQLGKDGAIVRYMLDHGFEPGMSGLDAYSTINAGGPGRYSASDANNGGAPGDVMDKWERQMAGHRENARRMAGIRGPMSSTPDGGLPSLEMPENDEPEYADNWLGGLEQKRDELRTKVGSKLGLNEKQMAGAGKALGGLGSFISRGGFS
jgi:hypothetical protein